MESHTFQDYLKSTYAIKKSGAASSYIRAIEILDELLKSNRQFDLENKSLGDIRDPILVNRIIDFVLDQLNKNKVGQKSIFDAVPDGKKSYHERGFCKAAIKQLGEYVNLLCNEEATLIMREGQRNGAKLSERLLKKFHIDDKGTEKEVLAKHRIGQDIFRAMLLDIYNYKCCLTGIEIPEVLRASHIIPWSENKKTRLNPENGICLSATYDAAFDRHLITFDEDYRLVLSKALKDVYTSSAFKTHFLNYEGKKISLPTMYLPSQQFLLKHRDQLIS